MQPSAPQADKFMMQPPTAPPTYNEAVGWNVQSGSGMQPVQQQPLYHAPSHSVPTSAPTMQVQVVNVVMVGQKPINTTCPNCRADVKTSTVTTPKSLAHVGCLALLFTGFCLCCWLPYCFDACKRTEHTCPNCKTLIGVYNG